MPQRLAAACKLTRFDHTKAVLTTLFKNGAIYDMIEKVLIQASCHSLLDA